jgi:exodeoxyribonuclease V gamma subunit
VQLHSSHRLESLADALAEVVATPIGSPWDAEVIAVPGGATGRWLGLRLAERFGVWAHPDFPSLDALVTRALAAVPFETGGLSGTALALAIARLLPGVAAGPGGGELAAYLEGDTGGSKRVALARRIADVFERYALLRPDLARGLERGPGEDWQSHLWRGAFPTGHPALRSLAALPDARPAGFPARVSIFGVAAVPPLHAEVLARVARWSDLHVFQLVPTTALLAPPREPAARAAVAAFEAGPSVATHPLLRSLGRVAAETAGVLAALGGASSPWPASPRPELVHALGALQADLLEGRLPPRSAPGAPPARVLSPGDRSITIASCHGPMREVEVLRDELLRAFVEIPGLEPRDVLVLVPDVDTYAPLVDAVLGAEVPGAPRLRHRVIDRAPRAELPLVDALAALLDVVVGRFGASDVVDLLAREPVRARFELDEEELDEVRAWVAGSGIRWGIDEAHRAEVGQPALRENTFRFGLDRLLLGVAMPAGRDLFGGALPFGDLEGAATEALGRFAAFCEGLFELRAALAGDRPIAAWCDALGAGALELLATDGIFAGQARAIRDALRAVAASARSAGFDEAVPLAVVRDALDHELAGRVPPRDFVSGELTVCGLGAGRVVPARVLALVGMNDDAFPRRATPLGFDRVARAPRPGDAAPRDLDRHLFLEALLAARDRLILTYTGQSLRKHVLRPPSVVVSELLDALAESFSVPPDPDSRTPKTVEQRLVAMHPLHPFSPRYFAPGDDALVSFDAALCEGAKASLGGRSAPPRFLRAPLPAPDPEPRDVALDELVRFFEDPTRALVRGRLGVTLGADVTSLEDREPTNLGGLERWQVGAALLARALDGEAPADALPDDVRAEGRLPLGTPGALLYEGLADEVRELASAAAEHHSGPRPPARPLSLDLPRARLVGTLGGLGGKGRVVVRWGKLGAKVHVAEWIRHLALSALAPRTRVESILVGHDARDRCAVVRFEPVRGARAMLGRLVDLYRLGQRVPLPFFAEASLAYAAALPDEDAALAEARRRFAESYEGAKSDYVVRLYGDVVPLEPSFRFFDEDAGLAVPSFGSLAEEIGGPLVAHRSDAS